MSTNKTRVSIDISWSAILKVLLVGLALWATAALSDILFMLFVVFIFVAGVNPVIRQMQRYMSRTIAVVLFFLGVLLGISLLFYVFVPLLIEQLGGLSDSLPGLIDRSREYFNGDAGHQYASYFEQIKTSAASGLQSVGGNLYQTTVNFFGGLATVVTGLILAFYILLEEKNAKEFFHQVLPHDKFEAVYTTVRKISGKMGDWIRGQLLLMLIIGVANFILFLILGIPSPFALGVWSGICELIPYVGPILGVIPALFIALAEGNYVQALLVFGFNFVLIQQLEANIIVPKVMGRAVGLSPVLVIVALAIGLKLFGLVGAIISLPTAAIISVIVGEWPNLRQIWERNGEEEPATP